MEESPTKRKLSADEVSRFARLSFGPDTQVADCAELSGGGFAAVWRVRLGDGRETVLKVGPRPEIGVLRYERDLMTAEASYFRMVREQAHLVPVPEVLFLEDSGEWLFTSFLPGTALPDLPNGSGVRRQVGQAMAHVHAIGGTEFGYTTGGRPHGPVWSRVFAAIVEDVLADAITWDVDLPVDAQVIRQLAVANAAVLDEVQKPVLVHFDLWDGNVLAAPGLDGEMRLSGLVDGERFLFGDPLIDFVSPAILQRMEDLPEHPFLHGYAQTLGRPITFDAGAKRRLALYRMHLYLLMTVELPSRAMNPGNHTYRGKALAAEVEALKANT